MKTYFPETDDEPRFSIPVDRIAFVLRDRLRFLGYADDVGRWADIWLDPHDGDLAVVGYDRRGEVDVDFYSRRMRTEDGEDSCLLCLRGGCGVPLTPYQECQLYQYEEATKNERRDEHWSLYED